MCYEAAVSLVGSITPKKRSKGIYGELTEHRRKDWIRGWGDN